jgi:hypothetical protein
MTPQTPQLGVIESETSRMTVTSSNAPLAETQHQPRYQLVRRNAAIAATENMTQDAIFKNVRQTGRSNDRKQQTCGCASHKIDIQGGQLTIKFTAGVYRELHDKFIATLNGKPPWSWKALIRTVHTTKHDDIVMAVIFVDGFRDNHLQEWTTQALKTLEEATESYMVEVIAKYSF